MVVVVVAAAAAAAAASVQYRLSVELDGAFFAMKGQLPTGVSEKTNKLIEDENVICAAAGGEATLATHGHSKRSRKHTSPQYTCSFHHGVTPGTNHLRVAWASMGHIKCAINVGNCPLAFELIRHQQHRLEMYVPRTQRKNHHTIMN